MMIKVDSWTLSRNTAFLMQPLAQALSSHPALELRRVVAEGGGASVPWDASAVPMIAPPVPTAIRDLPHFFMRYQAGLRMVAEFYRSAPRLVHVTMPSPFDLLYLPVARRQGAKILITVHDAVQHPGEESTPLRIAMNRVYGMADHLVAVSEFVGGAMRSSGRFRAPVHVVPGGLLEDLGLPKAARAKPVDRPLRLLFHGRIKHYKGVDLLLQAVRILNRRNVPVTLTIVGSGDTEKLAAQAATLSNVTTIFRWTSDDERAALYADHDINVLPYREASQSGVALRGLFAAMPTVATRVGALGEQLRDGENAVFAVDVSSEAIADAIERLVRYCDYAALSRGAAAAAAQQDAATIINRWAALYKRIASAV